MHAMCTKHLSCTKLDVTGCVQGYIFQIPPSLPPTWPVPSPPLPPPSLPQRCNTEVGQGECNDGTLSGDKTVYIIPLSWKACLGNLVWYSVDIELGPCSGGEQGGRTGAMIGTLHP